MRNLSRGLEGRACAFLIGAEKGELKFSLKF